MTADQWEPEGGEHENISYAAIFAAAPVSLLVLTPDLIVCEVNASYLKAVDRSREELLGRYVFDAFPESGDPASNAVGAVQASLERARDTGRPDTMAVQRYDIPTRGGGFEVRYWSPVNVPILDEDGRTILILHRAEDVTDFVLERQKRTADEAHVNGTAGFQNAEVDVFSRARELQALNAELRETRDALAVQVRQDPLTGMLTRPVMVEQLSHALARSAQRDQPVAVLFIDLDGMKAVNDRHGHAAGDELLRCFAQRLQGAVRPSDPVARFGGDEFVILLENLREAADAEAVAGRVVEAARGCSVGAGVRLPSASVGVALTGTPDLHAEEMIAQADAAMYRAKQAGGDRYEVFQPSTSP